jgi:hypothetical protein
MRYYYIGKMSSSEEVRRGEEERREEVERGEE